MVVSTKDPQRTKPCTSPRAPALPNPSTMAKWTQILATVSMGFRGAAGVGVGVARGTGYEPNGLSFLLFGSRRRARFVMAEIYRYVIKLKILTL